MKHEQIKESSLSRLYRGIEQHAVGALTAFRGDDTTRDNKDKNKVLLAALLSKGYSVTKVKGSYIENKGSPDEKEVGENSFFVINRAVDGDDGGQLEKDLIELGKKFDQDSIFSKQYGKKAMLIGTSDRENSFPGLGQTLEFDKSRFGDTDGEFFSRIKGRKFSFESAESIGAPTTINGIRAMKALAESIDKW